jgi:hypothetical protein
VSTRKAGVIDRKQLYIPHPTEWDFRKLDDAEIGRRLESARNALAKLESWASDLEHQREQARLDLWERLPTALLYEQKAKLTELENMGKELKAIAKLRNQASTAIEYIEGRLNGAGVTE